MKLRRSLLTEKVLDRFTEEYREEQFTDKELETIEHAAYVAMMNRHHYAQNHSGIWTDDDIYNDFIRVMSIHGMAIGNMKRVSLQSI